MLLCSCRPLRFVPPLRLSRPSRPLPAPWPGEPPEQQSAEAEADRVQDEYLAVAGQQQRPEQQRRDHDRNRQPLAPPQEPAEADRDSPDLWNRCQDVLDVHLHLLACCCPHRHPEHGSRVMGSVDERRTPPTVGCRTRKTEWGKRKRSSARVFRWGDRPLEAAVRGAAVLRAGHRTARGKRRRSSPRTQNVRGGKLRDVKRPACSERQTGACRSCGPSCVSAMPQAREAGRGAERAPSPASNGRSDQPRFVGRVPNGRNDQLRPSGGCPAAEVDQPQPLNGARREKGLSLQPPDVGRRRRAYHSVDSVRAACEGLITPQRQHSLVGRLFGLTRAKGWTPRFLGRETLEKPETASIITAAETRMEALWRPAAKSLPFMALLLHERVLNPYPAKLPATSATVPA